MMDYKLPAGKYRDPMIDIEQFGSLFSSQMGPSHSYGKAFLWLIFWQMFLFHFSHHEAYKEISRLFDETRRQYRHWDA